MIASAQSFGLVILFLFETASTAPTISLPINAQIPPVAQVGEAFNFTFSESTFSSQMTMRYRLTDAPSWLEIDSAGRRLYGQPHSQDSGSPQFGLVAVDESGSVTMPVTLVVSSLQGPSLNPSFPEQLSSLGTYQSPQALLFYPEASIDLVFSPDIFQETDASTHYSAIGVNNTPLPSWLQFDADTLTFRGKTPVFTSATELPQDFDIALVASDVPGFSQARASFRITVESHQLLFTSKNYTIEAEPGTEIQYQDVARTLTIDGQTMPLTNISSVSADQPSWLRLDNTTLAFSGTVPGNVESSNFTLTVADSIGDTATTTISIVAPGNSSATNLILGQIGPINVTIGAFFNYTIDRGNFAGGNISIALDAGNASSWLQFDNSSLEISGTVPADSRAQADEINLMVSEGGKSQSQAIILNLVDAAQGQPSTSMISVAPTSATTGITSPSTTGTMADTASTDHANLRVILPAVLVPLIVLFLIGLILCCSRRRRKQKEQSRQNGPVRRANTTGTVQRTSSIFRRASNFSRITPRAPLLPPPVIGRNEISSRGSHRTNTPASAAHGGKQIPTRPPRPPSGAPQIIRMILERDPDPLADFRETHHLVDEPRPGSATLPEPPTRAFTRSHSEPQRLSYKSQSRASLSSLLSRATNNRLSSMLETACGRDSGRPDLEMRDNGPRRPSSQPQHMYTGSYDSTAGTNTFDFQTQPASDGTSRGFSGSDVLTASGDWTTTSESMLDPSSSQSESANRNTSSTINGFFAQTSPSRAGTVRRSQGRFANTTIRGVTPSVSSFTASYQKTPPKRNSRRGSLLGAKRDSQGSAIHKRLSSGSIQRPRSTSSPSKIRRSWTSNNQYGDFLKARRQGPATIRFSSSGHYRESSSNYNRTSSILESSSSSNHLNDILRSSSDEPETRPELQAETDADADKENIGPASPLGLGLILGTETSPSSVLMGRERKRSRGSIQRLGRQMQMAPHNQHHLTPSHTQGRNLPFARTLRTASSRSLRSVTSTSASEISFRAIEEEMAEVEQSARYWKASRQGMNRRSSLHRLSALPESQGQTGQAGQSLRIWEGKATPIITTPQEELPTSRSFKGELGEWKGTDDEGSVATHDRGTEMEGHDFFPRTDGAIASYGSTSKVFI